MKSIVAEFYDRMPHPGVNHMRGMQYQIVLNITFCLLPHPVVVSAFIICSDL